MDFRKFMYEMLDCIEAESSCYHFKHTQNMVAELCPHTLLIIMNRYGLNPLKKMKPNTMFHSF